MDVARCPRSWEPSLYPLCQRPNHRASRCVIMWDVFYIVWYRAMNDHYISYVQITTKTVFITVVFSLLSKALRGLIEATARPRLIEVCDCELIRIFSGSQRYSYFHSRRIKLLYILPQKFSHHNSQFKRQQYNHIGRAQHK